MEQPQPVIHHENRKMVHDAKILLLLTSNYQL